MITEEADDLRCKFVGLIVSITSKSRGFVRFGCFLQDVYEFRQIPGFCQVAKEAACIQSANDVLNVGVSGQQDPHGSFPIIL